jgi:F-type H+-transporting ATPase subunit a
MQSKICSVFLLTAIMFLFTDNGYAAIGSQGEQTDKGNASVPGNETKKEAFNPGDFIFDHIKDAHEWHITSIGHRHISIPLPIILYSHTNGFDVFMSGNFHHGETAYKGYRLETTGANKGKIISQDGSKPLDLSITKNVAAMLFSIALLFLIFVSVGRRYKENPLRAPSGLQSFIEPIITFLRDDVAKSSIGPKYERYMPFLLTVFFFIFINNILGLIPIAPGGTNLTGNIAVTMVLALFTFVITNVSGNRNYWKHIVNTPGVPLWLKLPIPLIPLVELIGLFTKPFVLMVRLFANITAGHIIALGFISLIYIFGEMSHGLAYGVSVISILFNIFMMFLELLVAFIQAFVFTFLSAIYFGLAVEEHHAEHQEEHA